MKEEQKGQKKIVIIYDDGECEPTRESRETKYRCGGKASRDISTDERLDEVSPHKELSVHLEMTSTLNLSVPCTKYRFLGNIEHHYDWLERTMYANICKCPREGKLQIALL